MVYSINKEKKTKNVLYEPLMEYIIKKDYNYIWNNKATQEITKTIVTKAVCKFISVDHNFTKEDLFTDCYMCLVKAVNTYSPFSKKGFMPFLLYYYSTAKYLIDKPKSVSTLFAGKREIVTKKESENIRADREVYFESGNMMDMINNEDTFDSIYDKELLDALNTLPKNIKTLIVMTMNGEKQKDIGKVLGISQPMVCHYLTVLRNFLKAKDTEKALLKMQEYTMFTKQELKQTADLLNKFNIRDKVQKVEVEEIVKEEKKEKKKNKYNDCREINIYKGKGNVFICTANNVTEAAKITNGNKYSIYKVLTGCLHSSNNYVFRYADVDYYAPTKKEESIIKVEEVEDNMENDLNIQQQIDKLEKEKEVIQRKIDGLTNLKLLQEQIKQLQEQIQEQMQQLSDIN